MTDKKTGVQTQEAPLKTSTKLELTALEEKVVRMHHGLAAPATHELEMAVSEENTELVAKLKELEQRVLKQAGPRNNPIKRNIINSLRRK